MFTGGLNYLRGAVAVVRTSDEARDLLTSFARRHGITVSAMLEAISQRLPADDEVDERQREIIEMARAIDAERRRRD